MDEGKNENTATRSGGQLPPAIVTFARSWHALAAIRSLHARGVRVAAGDEFKLTPGALSKASDFSFTYPNPMVDAEGFVDAIEEAAIKLSGGVPIPEARPVLVPIQLETFVVAEHRERLERSVRLTLVDSELLEKVRDKGWLVRQARHAQVLTPRTWQPHNEEELESLVEEVTVPCIVKIRSGVGGAGLIKVEARAEIAPAVCRLVREHGLDAQTWPIIQELCAGEDLCVTSFFEHGSEVATMTYRNVSKVLESAPGVIRETVQVPAAEAAARRLLRHLSWHGVAQIDFLWDGESEPVLIEINPRFFGGLFQAIESGADYPWMTYCAATDRTVPRPGEIEIGVRTETPFLGFLATARQLATDSTNLEALKECWQEARKRLSDGDLGSGFSLLWQGLTGEFAEEEEERANSVEEVLRQNEDNISQLLFDEDPGASLGLLYPLAILFRHGRIDTELLMGLPATNPEAAAEPKRLEEIP